MRTTFVISRASLKNKDVVGLRNDTLGARIQDEENKLKTLKNRLLAMGIYSDTDLSSDYDEGSTSLSSCYAPSDSPKRKTTHRQRGSDTSSVNSVDEIMGNPKRTRRPKSTLNGNVSSARRGDEAYRSEKRSQARPPPGPHSGESSDSSVNEYAPFRAPHAKFQASTAAPKPSQRGGRPRNSRDAPAAADKPKLKRVKTALIQKKNREEFAASGIGGALGGTMPTREDEESDNDGFDGFGNVDGGYVSSGSASSGSLRLDSDDVFAAEDSDDFEAPLVAGRARASTVMDKLQFPLAAKRSRPSNGLPRNAGVGSVRLHGGGGGGFADSGGSVGGGRFTFGGDGGGGSGGVLPLSMLQRNFSLDGCGR